MDVIVSMKETGGRKVYHRPGCIYVKRIKPQNRIRQRTIIITALNTVAV